MASIRVKHGELPTGNHYESPGTGLVLPGATEVRDKALSLGIDTSNTFRPDPVRFVDKGILVKWGEDITISEGQCLWFMQTYLPRDVPVPKLYGWTRDGEQTFLYMELVKGDTLSDRWDQLSEDDRLELCRQLQVMVSSWRRLEHGDVAHDPGIIKRTLLSVASWFGIYRPQNKNVLSQIGFQALRDVMFYDAGSYPAGPFESTSAFHDWFAALATGGAPRDNLEHLAGLDDNVAVVFTHGDLHLSNMLVSKPGDGPVRIVAIIDWHQSGWMPEHWEWLKSQLVAGHDSHWSKKYLSKVLEPARFEYFYAWEYIRMATI